MFGFLRLLVRPGDFQMPISFFSMALLLFILSFPTLVDAAAAKRVDDAAVTAAGQCQLESWLGTSGKSHEFVALPTCGLTDRTDFTLGLEWLSPSDEPNETALVWQAKTRLTNPTNRLQTALALGGSFDMKRRGQDRTKRDYFVNLPVSFLAGDTTEFRVNAGMLRDQNEREWQTIAGIGVVHELSEHIAAFAETFRVDYRGDSRERGWQAGFLFPGTERGFDLDITVLNSRPDSQRRYSIILGFTLNIWP